MSFLTGIIGKTFFEILKGLFLQITWEVVLERFASRTIIWGLKALRDLSTNDVIQETVDDVIASLQGKRLKEIPQKE